MTGIAPNIIRFTKPNGDFYEGVSLDLQGSRIRLYITASNIDSLRGVTEPGTIVNFDITGWKVGDQQDDSVNMIVDVNGKRRPAIMDQHEYDGWRNGNTGETYGLRIVPKKDFGTMGSYSAPIRATIYEGWNVVFTTGRFKGCNAIPSAGWSTTYEGATKLILAFIAAGGDANSDNPDAPGFVDRFHALVRLTKGNK